MFKDGAILKKVAFLLCFGNLHCPKLKAKFRSMERSVDGMKLHREKYSGFIP
jgi:hypothetical protein